MLVERIKSPEFDFKEYRASYGRHSIHDYPAMLHYLLVGELITRCSSEEAIVYDPFCGSGVSIVESLRLKRRAIGTDINPIALLIADVRSSNLNIELINTYLNIFQSKFYKLQPDVPEIKNATYWFKEDVITDLGRIRSFIKDIEDIEVLKFFLIAFSQTVRDVSNNKKGEFKRYRLDHSKLKSFNPNTLKTFLENAYQYLNVISNDKLPSQDYFLFLKDVREEIPLKNVDLVITSPPYGDSKTTVAYGQFSSFSFDWLKGLNPYGDADLRIDSLCLGGKRIEKFKTLPSNNLYEALEKIEKVDYRRSLEVYSFFYDYYLSIQQIVKTLSDHAYVCFIVGNRIVKGVQIEMDLITVDFFESFGLKLENIFVREISNKRIPIRTSPSNRVGQTSNTMLSEYIVVMKN